MTDREQITTDHIDAMFDSLRVAVEERARKHGPGAFVSKHEAYGVLAEEMDELLEELRGSRKDLFMCELEDVAVAAIWGLMSV